MDTSQKEAVHPNSRQNKRTIRAFLVLTAIFVLGLTVGVTATAFFVPGKLMQIAQEGEMVDKVVEILKRRALSGADLSAEQSIAIDRELSGLVSDLKRIRSEVAPEILSVVQARVDSIRNEMTPEQIELVDKKLQLFLDNLNIFVETENTSTN